MNKRNPGRVFGAGLSAVAALMVFGPLFWGAGCTRPGTGYREIASGFPVELPWEVRGTQGEMLLPDVFYAEASENEQVMPLTFESPNGRRYQIDRLIYPTIGNPNLYSKANPKNVLELVLRLEEKFSAGELSFFLVSRENRTQQTAAPAPIHATSGHDVVRLTPSRIQIDAHDENMPEEFKKRFTHRIIFEKDALQAVAPGLYDIRFEATGKTGPMLYEYQYNAVRIFDEKTSSERYTIINITDTQVSLHSSFTDKTLVPLESFVSYVNTSAEPNIREAAFITFTGDLHNGGSPGTVKPNDVAQTYNREATMILNTLKELNYPIFLIPGNHDGYVSMGHAPKGIFGGLERALYSTLDQVVAGTQGHEWPDFTLQKFRAFIAATKQIPGGRHLDIFTGRHTRKVSSHTWSDWTEVPEAQRNMVLYDGFYQWRRTYGPLYHSWSFGRNHFSALNTFELRQHRRAGWGMYAINYGGGMSKTQVAWLLRDLHEAQARDQDITLLSHHDPRGGHRGKGFPYYFNLLDYRGLENSAVSFLTQDHLAPLLCQKAPRWLTGEKFSANCIHDGLQEWMRADSDFDCEESQKLANGFCDTTLFSTASAESGNRKDYWYSGHALIHAIASTPNLRTWLSGHTHESTTEILQTGAELIPMATVLDAASIKEFEELETADPGRDELSTAATAKAENTKFVSELAEPKNSFENSLTQPNRELVIIRSTTSSAIANQSYFKRNNMGFSVFTVQPRTDGHGQSQINEVDMFVYDPPVKSKRSAVLFDRVGHYRLARDRTWHVGGAENPLSELFREK